MRWPGTIQPSRFLSHTGQVMPGVRKVVSFAAPAAGQNWSFSIPGGVGWWIAGGTFYITTSATVGNRSPQFNVTIDGTLVWRSVSQFPIVASTVGTFSFTSATGEATPAANTTPQVIPLPPIVLPEGSFIQCLTNGIQAGDQVSGISMYIEEYYFTDAQLSEDARLHAELEHDIAVYEYEQAERTQGGA